MCETMAVKLELIKDDVRYVHCTNCDLVFVDESMSDRMIATMYEEEAERYFLDHQKIDLDYNVSRYRFEVQAFRKINFNLSANILEIGCATGSFLHLLKGHGFANLEGIDISEPSIAFAKKMGLKCESGDFLKMDYQTDFYDCIVMWATLEHLLHPRLFCEKAFRCLKEGAFLFISVPNYKSVTQRLLGKKNRYVGSGHLNYFSKSNVSMLLTGIGYEVVSTEFHAINPINIYQDLLGRVNMDSAEFKIKSQHKAMEIKRRVSSHVALRVLFGLLDGLLNFSGLGDLLIITARKTSSNFMRKDPMSGREG